ncbi:hypothetical protein FO519_004740 [Halicephalobus sp. NKZ332]|nr:hypothetical protein FO519_004740 [Halicephalobus sp. NKZ332]
MSVEENQEPLPAIIRVRRKRTAPPSSGWMVSAKKNRVEEDNGGNLERPAIFKLAVTAPDPSIANVSDLILPKKVAVVDYDREKGVIRQHGIVDEQQDQINTAAEMVEKMEVSDVPGPSIEKNKAPLASNESLDDEQYVYDFYYTKPSAFSAVQVDLTQELSIREATDEELMMMFMDDDDDDNSVHLDDDQDSNDENNPNNEYPDEGEFDEEHDTTSEEYDHYGGEEEVYNDYLDDEDDGNNY